MTVTTAYPAWVMYIAVVIIVLGICPVVLVLLFRRFQCLKFDTDIQQGSIRRNETTVSTRRMMNDTDVSFYFHSLTQKLKKILF